MKTTAWTEKHQMAKAILVATVSMLTMIGCAQNNGGTGARLRNSNGAVPTNTAGMLVSPLVYNTSVTGSSANVSAQGLLGLSVPAGTKIGSVDNSTGMSITGKVHFDASSPSQNMIGSQSYVEIQIKDSYSVQNPNQYSPFIVSIGMNSLSTGWLQPVSGASYEQTQMVFEDSFGWVMIEGNMNQATFNGQVFWGSGDFESATTWTYLGDFTTQSCGAFFTCQ